jgi:hypothetical protein
MNWIKDHLIVCLAALSAVLALALIIVILYYRGTVARKDTEIEKYKGAYATLYDANSNNHGKLVEMTGKYNKLVEQQRLDVGKAAKAAEQLEQQKKATAKVVADNQELRAALARGNKDVQDYLSTGMPHELACQLWPDAAPCQGAVR